MWWGFFALNIQFFFMLENEHRLSVLIVPASHQLVLRVTGYCKKLDLKTHSHDLPKPINIEWNLCFYHEAL